MLSQEDWEVVRFPAIAEDHETWAFDTELGLHLFTRQRGEALHAERQPLATLEQIRRVPGFIPGIGEYNFAGQYPQAPAPQGGGMVKAAWFRSYAPSERPEKFDSIAQSWDTANKASELSDFSVCTTWGINGKDLQMLDWFKQAGSGPSSNAGIWHLYKEQYEAQQAAASNPA